MKLFYTMYRTNEHTEDGGTCGDSTGLFIGSRELLVGDVVNVQEPSFQNPTVAVVKVYGVSRLFGFFQETSERMIAEGKVTLVRTHDQVEDGEIIDDDVKYVKD